jgi:DnaJ-class molecular chaperone
MPRKDFVKDTVKFVRNVDSVCKMVTGKRLKDVFASTVAVLTPSSAEDPDDPYNVLCVNRNAGEKLVKMAFRAAAFEYHPDTGAHPDNDKFQRAVEAYKKIQEERNGGGGEDITTPPPSRS